MSVDVELAQKCDLRRAIGRMASEGSLMSFSAGVRPILAIPSNFSGTSCVLPVVEQVSSTHGLVSAVITIGRKFDACARALE